MTRLPLHPSRRRLYEHAELLDQGQGRMDAAVARHVAGCEACRRELHSIRTTMMLSELATDIAPTRESSASLLLAARYERNVARRLAARDWARLRLGLACAAGVLALCAGVATSPGNIGRSPARNPSDASVLPIDVLRQASAVENLLSVSVLSEARLPLSPWEASQRRAANAWDTEIDDALFALAENPACARAVAVLDSSRKRLGETLKTLYEERSL